MVSSESTRSTAITDLPLPVEAAWQAVLDRERRFDGRFVYAVLTTGIYCRPSCPSRRPRRENVTFFAAAEDAVRNGFRACRRCHPQSEIETTTERRVRSESRPRHTRTPDASSISRPASRRGTP